MFFWGSLLTVAPLPLLAPYHSPLLHFHFFFCWPGWCELEVHPKEIEGTLPLAYVFGQFRVFVVELERWLLQMGIVPLTQHLRTGMVLDRYQTEIPLGLLVLVQWVKPADVHVFEAGLMDAANVYSVEVDASFVVLTAAVAGCSDLWKLPGCYGQHARHMRHQRTSQFFPQLIWLYTLGDLGDTK